MPCARVSGTKPPPLSVCEGGGSFTPDIEFVFYIDYDIKEYSKFDWEWYSEVMKDGVCTTDFSREDWEECLEKEMFEKMGKYCAFRGIPLMLPPDE